MLERNAGIFGNQENWKKVYIQAVKEADCLALGWYEPTAHLEKRILGDWSGVEVTLRTLEPYYVEVGRRC